MNPEIVRVIDRDAPSCVLLSGSHGTDQCYEVTGRTLNIVFEQLRIQNVNLEGIVLKPNMVISALDCPDQANSKQVAEFTV